MRRHHLVLQQRDYALLQTLSDYRYLTTSQLRGMFFSKGPFIYRRLKKLSDYGLIVRLQREVIGQAAELVHTLAPEGARQLSQHIGIPTSSFTVHRKASRPFLDHELALNQFRLAFEQAVERQADMSIEQWSIRYKIDLPQRRTLIPDAYIILNTARGQTHFFVELDRCTESVRRTFRAKLKNYAAYHSSGRFSRQSNAKFFRVLTITLHDRAIHALLSVGKDISPSSIFWFSHLGLVSEEAILTQAIWKRADAPADYTALYRA